MPLSYLIATLLFKKLNLKQLKGLKEELSQPDAISWLCFKVITTNNTLFPQGLNYSPSL